MIKKIKLLVRKVIWSPEKRARKVGVKIGERCDIQNVSFGSEPYLIEIGNHVQLTAGTKIFTHGAGWVLREKYPNIDFFGKVKIMDNVYVGNNVLILPGVTIGENSVIAAGTVVTKSVPKNSVLAGNPGKVIDTIENFENKMLKFDLKCKKMNPSEKRAFLLAQDEHKFIIK
tara:strand:+ start:91984 stop:92499 length:516 start_codon:yes stop_codon:yes gene_type:complete